MQIGKWESNMPNVNARMIGIHNYDYDYSYNEHTRTRKVPVSESHTFPLSAPMVQTYTVELLVISIWAVATTPTSDIPFHEHVSWSNKGSKYLVDNSGELATVHIFILYCL